MLIGKLFVAALLPLLATANTHSECWCKTSSESVCQKSACIIYGERRAYFDLPAGVHPSQLSTQWIGQSCIVRGNNVLLDGIKAIGGKEYAQACKDACNAESRCN
ncbi:hypothetical protein Cob_v003268 [Colletotrichum orbiculare MAFF 240422]|uniref:Uncharacterized protein n=1 Tax=Colletotrichum orbiculare (strain 104-T / ATCC 96160 / CBS 514.97 / LARS 414 / MAFF 240422) TaxID=1213857 RepID=A0A484G3Y5_COLOR|nr:hypothetical protein Cob_v003268 [Colletotrichum orbiculare MAFF 240422]